MLDALLTLDDELQLYSIVTFMALPEAEIDRYRQHLSCEQCGGKAYYRKQSIDGKSACFGSRYHKLDCDEARRSTQTSQSKQENCDALEVDRLIVTNTSLQLDFSLTAIIKKDERPHPSASKPFLSKPLQEVSLAQIPKQIAEAPSSIQDKEVSVTRLSMDKLLNSLLRGSNLASADTLIEIDAGYQFKAKNLFVNFADAAPSDSIKKAKPKMYWGTLSHSDPQMAWLNPADCHDMGIPLGRHQITVLKRFGITDKRDIEGAGIILFGKCYWNKDKSRKIIELWNSERLFISPLADK
ncbi:conserved hypothetical protein [Shewanella denitrificans OS217]|jgi:hypothetical protein|uniref:Uncharacterized protein n=1 Tax=Shewanella denitrificans (strain OS217 / ATCC BAA-1090 / DSM 15013) TaxID=318161 RepID=Q12N32_SHEDO|nr:hypothetical protein [Shewanella denitrificans]ABE55144.1 conserved hypothetical protein [Shewanella denitrificans OS217]